MEGDEVVALDALAQGKDILPIDLGEVDAVEHPVGLGGHKLAAVFLGAELVNVEDHAAGIGDGFYGPA